MCFHYNQSKSVQDLEKRFNAEFEKTLMYRPSYYNGFQFPSTPVITNEHPEKIQLYNWGLIPSWAKDDSIRKNTLNARIETIHEKPSFRNIINNRCLVIADSFYEWQWLDEKGKQKQKFELILPNNEPFSFAGLWSEWVNKLTGEVFHTYTILTSEANELMSNIHNSKKRMPLIVCSDYEKDWLGGKKLITQNEKLIANEV